MNNLIGNILLGLYITFKTGLVAAYFYIVVLMYQYSLAPLIAMYGFWNFFGHITFLTFCGFVTCFTFAFVRLPKQPQATYKESTND
jgi:hypothetical protein